MNEALKARLEKEFGLTEAQIAALEKEGVKEESDIGLLSMQQLKEFTGCGAVVVQKISRAFAPKPDASAEASAMVYGASTIDVLPEVPTEDGWLNALRAGGVLKTSTTTVNSAIRAALAHKAGLFGVPTLLASRIETFAEENDEQVSGEYFKLRKQLLRVSYAEVFEAVEGLDGNYVTEPRKKALFHHLDTLLWPAIVSFHTALAGWVSSWHQGASSPAAVMMVMAMAATGNRGGMPPGMMQVPETGTLRDEANSFNDVVNKVFAGTRAPIASALAYEANQIVKTLENPALPGLMGAANRDQMLKMLGVDVPATYTRLETNLIRYVLSILKVKDVAVGDDEQRYLSALFMLGNQIPWDKLSEINGLPRRAGLGNKL